MQYTYWDIFYTAQDSLWSHWFWILLVILPFLFYLFHISKMFPFEDFLKIFLNKKDFFNLFNLVLNKEKSRSVRLGD